MSSLINDMHLLHTKFATYLQTVMYLQAVVWCDVIYFIQNILYYVHDTMLYIQGIQGFKTVVDSIYGMILDRLA